MLLAITGYHEPALPHLEAVIKSNPADVFARQQIIQSHFMLGKVSQCLDHIEAFVQMQPEDPVGHIFRGKSMRARGRGAEAAAAFRETLRLQPEWLAAMNELAWLLSTHADAKSAPARKRWNWPRPPPPEPGAATQPP